MSASWLLMNSLVKYFQANSRQMAKVEISHSHSTCKKNNSDFHVESLRLFTLEVVTSETSLIETSFIDFWLVDQAIDGVLNRDSRKIKQSVHKNSYLRMKDTRPHAINNMVLSPPKAIYGNFIFMFKVFGAGS